MKKFLSVFGVILSLGVCSSCFAAAAVEEERVEGRGTIISTRDIYDAVRTICANIVKQNQMSQEDKEALTNARNLFLAGLKEGRLTSDDVQGLSKIFQSTLTLLWVSTLKDYLPELASATSTPQELVQFFREMVASLEPVVTQTPA